MVKELEAEPTVLVDPMEDDLVAIVMDTDDDVVIATVMVVQWRRLDGRA
jgi:hypothetical protein